MKQWEYTIFQIQTEVNVTTFMNSFGSLGWECFYLDKELGHFFCKRERRQIIAAPQGQDGVPPPPPKAG